MFQINRLAEQTAPRAIALRRYFRMHPEIGCEEKATQSRIMSELKDLGFEPKEANGTGVIAQLNGAFPGKTVAVRADIDALPVNDEINQPYKSTIPGVSHACGHDAHMAIALGLADVFSQIKSELHGNVRFIFQPSEEVLPHGGAQGMIAEGALDGVDAIIGAHVWQPIEVGKIGVSHGTFMAAPDEFSITVKGRGGHGSMPHQAIDPIFVGAQIVLALKTITGNAIDPREPAVLSIGMFKSGEVFNIIPDTATIVGTIRTFSQDVRDKIHQQIDQICRGCSQASGAEYSIKTTFGYPPVINHPEISQILAKTGEKIFGPAGVEIVKPTLCAEDFSYYLEKVPGVFFFIGAGNEAKQIIYPHHHPKFDIDEACIKNGIWVMGQTVLEILNEKNQ